MMRVFSGGWLPFAVMVVGLAGCAAQPPAPLPERDYFWIVHSRERSDSDRARDQDFQPDTLLWFQGVRPGTRIAEVGAGDGYFTELMARIAGPKGKIYAQNPHGSMDAGARRRLAARMKNPVMGHVVAVERPFDDPVPADARGLDLVVSNYSYHRAVAHGADRARMNRAIFDALKPGGIYVVTDYAAAPGRGFNDAARLSRVEESALLREVEGAGFKGVEAGGFLRGRSDPLTVPAGESGIRADAFALKFVRPE